MMASTVLFWTTDCTARRDSSGTATNTVAVQEPMVSNLKTRPLAHNLICHDSDEGGPPDVTGPIIKMYWRRPQHLRPSPALRCGSPKCPVDLHHDDGQPAARIPDLAGIGAAQPRPSVPHGVICISAGPQYAIRDRAQRRPLGRKGLRQPFRLPRKPVLIGHIPSTSFVMVVMYGSHSV